MIKTEYDIISDYDDWIESVPANNNKHYEELVDKRNNRMWIDRKSEVEFLKSFFFDLENRISNNLTKDEILFKIEKRIKELLK